MKKYSRQKNKENTQSFTGRINDADIHIGGTSVRNVEKAGRKTDSVQSKGSRQCYETEKEKQNVSVKVFNWI